MKHQFWSCHSLKRSVMGHAMPSDRTPAAAAKAAPRVFPIFSPLPEVPLTYPSFSLPLPSQHLSGVSFCALCGDREAPTRPRTFRATTCRPLCGKARPAPVQLRVPTGVFRIRRAWFDIDGVPRMIVGLVNHQSKKLNANEEFALAA